MKTTSLNTIIPLEYIKKNKKLQKVECHNYSLYGIRMKKSDRDLIIKTGGVAPIATPTIADIINNAEELFGNKKRFWDLLQLNGIVKNHLYMKISILLKCHFNKTIDEIATYILKNIK